MSLADALDVFGQGGRHQLDQLLMGGAADALRQRRQDARHLGLHLARDVQRVGLALPLDAKPDGRLAADAEIAAVLLGADLDARDLAVRPEQQRRQLDLLLEEITDRFGKLPAQGQTLFDTHRLRLLVKPLCIQKLDATNDQITLQFSPEFAKNPPIEPIKIINLIQKNRSYKLAGQDKISLLRHCPTLTDKVAAVKDMIRQLTN